MIYKVGDRVLVEGVVRADDKDGNLFVLTEQQGILSTHSQFVVAVERVRPWAEKAVDPTREVWRSKSGNYRVMSDGDVEWCGNELGGPAKFDVPGRKLEVLAEYVRQTAK